MSGKLYVFTGKNVLPINKQGAINKKKRNEDYLVLVFSSERK